MVLLGALSLLICCTCLTVLESPGWSSEDEARLYAIGQVDDALTDAVTKRRILCAASSSCQKKPTDLGDWRQSALRARSRPTTPPPPLRSAIRRRVCLYSSGSGDIHLPLSTLSYHPLPPSLSLTRCVYSSASANIIKSARWQNNSPTSP